MTESLHEELFTEPKSSLSLKLIAVIAALVVTVAVFAGYAYLRQRHAEDSGLSAATSQTAAEPRKSPKALIRIDDATLKAGKTVLAGSVTNTSAEPLANVSVELELKRRKDAVAERKLIPLEPSTLEPQQEGKYSIQLQAQDYLSARLVGLKAGPDSSSVAYTTAQGQKRPPERIESKTITIDKRPPSKRDDFLNSPDKPARVP
ncbi:MAG: DUF3426 domain-containing protein [Acidobacteriota bacterium]|nr:DUF3426 domain-containing protein [Acidobacteriota bacterium]